jgi:hypothetical protein
VTATRALAPTSRPATAARGMPSTLPPLVLFLFLTVARWGVANASHHHIAPILPCRLG